MRGSRPSIAWCSMDVVHGRTRRRRKVWSVSQEECFPPGEVAGRFMITCLQVCTGLQDEALTMHRGMWKYGTGSCAERDSK
jgi:hypothetical protein